MRLRSGQRSKIEDGGQLPVRLAIGPPPIADSLAIFAPSCPLDATNDEHGEAQPEDRLLMGSRRSRGDHATNDN